MSNTSSFIDPSQQTPLFTAQQVTCAYPISDTYATVPRFLYYSLLVGCLLIRWQTWLSDAFLGAAATYAGVAAMEAFVLFAGYPAKRELEMISIPNVDPGSVSGNATLSALANLVVGTGTLDVMPTVMDFDIDAILAIVITGYLFMLPVHCFSTHIRGYRARHLLMGLWNIMMLCAGVCALTMWTRLGDVPFQFRYCYPRYPDLDTISNDGWVSSLWQGNWNSTIWNTFADPAAYNSLTENCFYPCFNTSQVLRRTQTIQATLNVNSSPRTSTTISESQIYKQDNLVYYMYVAIIVSAVTAVVLLVVNATNMKRFTTLPLDHPILFWTERKQICRNMISDVKNLFHRPDKKKGKNLPKSEKEALVAETERRTKRRKSLYNLIANFFAFGILFIVVIVVPITWVGFIVWIEWWIHYDLAGTDTPKQVGQWGPAVSVALIMVSALVLQLRHRIATKEEVEDEIKELKKKLRTLECLRERKM